MKVDYRRSTAAYKTSHRCQFSLRVGSRVNHSRLLCHRESFVGNVFETPA